MTTPESVLPSFLIFLLEIKEMIDYLKELLEVGVFGPFLRENQF